MSEGAARPRLCLALAAHRGIADVRRSSSSSAFPALPPCPLQLPSELAQRARHGNACAHRSYRCGSLPHSLRTLSSRPCAQAACWVSAISFQRMPRNHFHSFQLHMSAHPVSPTQPPSLPRLVKAHAGRHAAHQVSAKRVECLWFTCDTAVDMPSGGCTDTDSNRGGTCLPSGRVAKPRAACSSSSLRSQSHNILTIAIPDGGHKPPAQHGSAG